jgi:DNA-binding GntR family transcriptional regulator
MNENDVPPPPLDGSPDSLYEYLRKLIVRGLIPAGVPLSQVQLAQQLGVSRTPLREALRMLQNEGLIAGEMNHRVYVPSLSLSHADELYAMRITVEALGLRLSLPHLTDQDIDEIEGHMERMNAIIAMNDSSLYDEGEAAHYAFHLGFVSHAGEHVLHQVRQLHDHTDRYRYTFFRQELRTPADTRAVHEAILEAARSRNTDLTVSLLGLDGDWRDRGAGACLRASRYSHRPEAGERINHLRKLISGIG